MVTDGRTAVLITLPEDEVARRGAKVVQENDVERDGSKPRSDGLENQAVAGTCPVDDQEVDIARCVKPAPHHGANELDDHTEGLKCQHRVPTPG